MENILSLLYLDPVRHAILLVKFVALHQVIAPYALLGLSKYQGVLEHVRVFIFFDLLAMDGS